MTVDEIYEHFRELCNTPSDINEHLQVLRKYADECEHVTEFGVRGAVSLYAFLSSKAKRVVAVDIVEAYRPPEIEKLQFICGDTLKIEIEPTDMLFVDTVHTFKHLSEEIRRHADKVKRFLAFHDTGIFGEHGEDGSTPGLKQAVADFLNTHDDWGMVYTTEANNGLTVLERELQW